MDSLVSFRAANGVLRMHGMLRASSSVDVSQEAALVRFCMMTHVVQRSGGLKEGREAQDVLEIEIAKTFAEIHLHVGQLFWLQIVHRSPERGRGKMRREVRGDV